MFLLQWNVLLSYEDRFSDVPCRPGYLLGANTKQACVSLLPWEHNILYHAPEPCLNVAFAHSTCEPFPKGKWKQKNVANPCHPFLRYSFQTLVWLHTTSWADGPLQALRFFVAKRPVAKFQPAMRFAKKGVPSATGAMWKSAMATRPNRKLAKPHRRCM